MSLDHLAESMRQVNQLPGAAFTQIFLSRIVFSLKQKQIKLASSSRSPMLETTFASSTPRMLRLTEGQRSREESDQTLAGSPTLYQVFSLTKSGIGRRRTVSEHVVELNALDSPGKGKPNYHSFEPNTTVPYEQATTRHRNESERTLLPLSPSPLPPTNQTNGPTAASTHQPACYTSVFSVEDAYSGTYQPRHGQE